MAGPQENWGKTISSKDKYKLLVEYLSCQVRNYGYYWVGYEKLLVKVYVSFYFSLAVKMRPLFQIILSTIDRNVNFTYRNQKIMI